MQIIPIRAIPAQSLQVVLDGQECTITLFWRWGHLYMDLLVGTEIICRGAVCRNGAAIVQAASADFSGSLHFWDTRGKQKEPGYKELGERFILVYMSAGEALPDALKY